MRPLVFPALFLVLILARPTARAQDAGSDGVSLNVLSDRVAIGEIGQLFVKIANEEAALPQRIEVPGLEVIFSGQQSSITLVNGAQTVETTYFYRFRGDTPGTFTIPPFEIRLRNRSVTTRPITVTVFERDGSEAALDATKPFFAKLELSRDEFYVNEIIPFTVTAYVRGRNAVTDVVSAKLEHESFVMKGFREVRTDGADVGNTFYSSAVIPSHLFGLRPGTHRLGPAEVAVRVLDTDSGFGLSSFFQRTVTREMVTNTVNVTVKALPEGAPASFTGGIGQFTMTAKPSTSTLALGDPVSMEFEITGVGNLRTMGAPVFAIPQTGIWKTYEANKQLDDANDSDGFSTGKASFSRVIIPEAKTDSIPEFHLTYFDPSKNEYVTLKSDPVPLSLIESPAGGEVAAIRFPAEGGTAGIEPARRPEPQFQDILHIHTGPARWLATAPSGEASLLYYLVQAVLSVAFCTLAGLAAMRGWRSLREVRTTRGSKPSFARALREVPGPGSNRHDYFRSVANALEAWRSNQTGAPPDLIQAVDALVERCNAVLYSGNAETGEPVTETERAEFGHILKKLARA